LIGIAVAQVLLNPLARDREVQTALKVGIAHVEEIVAPQRTTRDHPVAHENAKDLAADVFIRHPGWHVRSAAWSELAQQLRQRTAMRKVRKKNSCVFFQATHG
jgi:hypothetical protein